MSEDRPITGELRRAMVEGNYHFDGHHIVREELAIGRERFYGLCDAIDAVHAALEDESAGLRERLARLDKRDDYMHDGWVRLPKDANGEYVRIGDVMEWPDGSDEPFEVVGIGTNGTLYYMYDESCEWTNASTKRHYHAPTIKDVLREFAQEMNENLGMYTGEAIDADEWRDADARTVEKYAARLRLAEGDAE